MNKVAKKIVLVGHIDGYGGAQTAFKELYDFVREEGYQVKTILLTDDLTRSPFAHDSNVLGSISHKGSFLNRNIKKIAGVVRSGIRASQFNPDIFVCVGLSNSSNILARYFLNKRCFKVGQDFIAMRDKSDSMWLSSKQVMDGVAVQAPSMLSYWQGVTKGITGINWLPCFPEPPYLHLAKKNTNKKSRSVKLCYFGRLADNKGLPLLLEALATSQFTADVSIDLWGQGAEEASLRQLASELHLDDSVNFMGSYPHGEEGAKLMTTYDALILTSTRMEGLPLILIEAMSYGLPFLSTDVGAIRDCCVGNPDALLVQPVQDDITEGLRQLVMKIQTNDFDSERLHSFYLTNFSYEVMADRWRTCFDSPQDFFYGN